MVMGGRGEDKTKGKHSPFTTVYHIIFKLPLSPTSPLLTLLLLVSFSESSATNGMSADMRRTCQVQDSTAQLVQSVGSCPQVSTMKWLKTR